MNTTIVFQWLIKGYRGYSSKVTKKITESYFKETGYVFYVMCTCVKIKPYVVPSSIHCLYILISLSFCFQLYLRQPQLFGFFIIEHGVIWFLRQDLA